MRAFDTPVTYSSAEAANIRGQVRRGAETLTCPRCGSGLERGPQIRRKGRLLQEVACSDCRRCLMVEPREA